MGVLPEPFLRLRDADPLEHDTGLLQGLGLVQAPVAAQGLGHLLAHGVDRVEGGHGLLEDHGDLVAPDVPQAVLRGLGQVDDLAVPAAEEQLSPGDAAPAQFHQADQAQGRDRFAGPGLAHQGHGLARLHGQPDTVHAHNRAVVGLELHPQVLYLHQLAAGHGYLPKLRTRTKVRVRR